MEKINLLLVEDDAGDVVLVSEFLSKDPAFECQVTLKRICKEAVAELKKKSFDIVITDLNLPDKEGITTFTDIYVVAEGAPVVILSGLEDEKLAIECVQKGAQDYLLKNELNQGVLKRAIIYAIARKKLEKVKDELLDNVSHELRTPLAIVKESISQVSDGFFGETSKQQKKYLNLALKNLIRLSRIVDNLLDYSRSEKGTFSISKEETDFVALCREIVKDYGESAKKKGLTLESHFPEESIVAPLDKNKIIRVMTNLLDNALKFTEKGGVQVFVKGTGKIIECTIKDTGKGIPGEELPQVFDRFKQVGREYGPGEKGTGLGLSLCKKVIESHEGKIWIKSEPGLGSRVVFTLPF